MGCQHTCLKMKNINSIIYTSNFIIQMMKQSRVHRTYINIALSCSSVCGSLHSQQ